MTLLDDLTEGDVLGWESAGVKTLEDLRATGNAAVVRHRNEVRRRTADEAEWWRITDRLAELAAEPWTVQVWRRDPRFANLLPPRWEVRTIRDLALRGTDAEKRLLWGIVGALEARLALVVALPVDLAVAGYVEAISSQHGVRLELLLACTGLNGRDPITQREAARVLEVSDQRVSQIVAQLYRRRDKVTQPGGIWMPQVDAAAVDGWPHGYTAAGIDAIRRFLQR